MANYFTFNEISCKEYGLKCKDISHISFASKSYESIKVPGRTGNLIIDDGSYNNKTVTVIAYLDMRNIPVERPIIGWDEVEDPATGELVSEPIYGENREDRIFNIKHWLIGHTGYKPLVFDDKFKYNAIVSGEVEFSEIFTDYYEIEIDFECVEVMTWFQ